MLEHYRFLLHLVALSVLVDANKDLHQLLVIGGTGYLGHNVNQSEVIDLIHGWPCARPPADFPVNVHTDLAAFVQGQILSCKGSTPPDDHKCFAYDQEKHEWKPIEFDMAVSRNNAGSTVFDGGRQWAIVGGYGEDYLDSMEIYGRDGRFLSGPPLPVALAGPCLTAINDTHLMSLGGFFRDDQGQELASDKVFWLNTMDTDASWVEMAAMPEKDAYFSCQTVNSGQEVVAVFGLGHTWILSLADLMWRQMADLQLDLFYEDSVPFQDSILISGGVFNETAAEVSISNALYVLNLEEAEWMKLDQVLQVPRFLHASVMVPETALNC